MMTSRGRIVLVVAATATAIALIAGQEPTALASLALFLWFCWVWITFRFQIDRSLSVLIECQRQIDGNPNAQVTTTAGRDIEVVLSARVPRVFGGLRFWIEDAVAAGCEVIDSYPSAMIDPQGEQVVRITYRIRPQITGKLVFAGIRVAVTDKQGFFRDQKFISLRQQITSLPFMIRPETTSSVLKRDSVQQMTGHHRFRQPGFGSELLEIRDYRPGDAPRSIAWKASARLGRLLTCEYESEVPIRSTLLCDLSAYQYAGRPGPAAVDRVVAAAASVARLLLSDRDPVAGTVVAGSRHVHIKHGGGERQLTRLFQQLLSPDVFVVPVEDIPIPDLTDVAWLNGRQRFPELFDWKVNRPRVGLFSTWRGDRRREFGRRQQLCFALSHLYRLPVGYSVRLQCDASKFRDQCRTFLRDFPPTRLPISSIPNVQNERAIEKQAINSICKNLLESVARAKDNELFVVIGRSPVSRDSQHQLENAIRVARARYHRVMFVDVGRLEYNKHVFDATARRMLTATHHQDRPDARTQLESLLTPLDTKVARFDDQSMIHEVVREIELLQLGRAQSASGGRARGMH